MKNILLILYLIVAWVNCNDDDQIKDYVSKVIVENLNSVVYFVTDCHINSQKTIMQMIDELSLKFPNSNANIITVPVSENAIERPSIFTKNFQQLRDAFENYVCISSITYEGLETAGGLPTAITRTAKQMHQQDVVLVFLGGLDENLTASLPLVETLQRNKVPVNIVWSGNSNLPEIYANMATKTGGQIFTYEAHTFYPKNLSYKDDVIATDNNSNYEMKIFKKTLKQNTRISLVLPENTFHIFLTINGDLTKALLISPSGVIINVTPPESETKESNINSQNSIVTFKSPITNSPSNWTFSGSGDKYNITLIMLMNRKANRIKDQIQERNYDTYDDALTRENNMTNEQQTHTDVGLEKREDNGQPMINEYGQLRAGALVNNLFLDTIINSIPTIIDVDPLSTFFVYPSEKAKIVFNVRNNKPIPSIYNFNCYYMQQPCFVGPTRVHLNPQQRVQVLITVRAEGSEGSSNVVSLISRSVDITDKKVYLFVGKQKSDNTKPDIDYEYNGNCNDANTGNTCHKKRWTASILAQDSGSGLLNFWSEPIGLIHTTEFIVGTKDVVSARYSASCCNPKVDVSAIDLKGNSHRVTLDVEHQFLSVIEIAAIVLAAILLILIIVIAVYCFLRWRRKRNEESFLRN